MNNSISTNRKLPGKTYFLSEFVGAKVVQGSKKIGTLSDFAIIDGDLAAEVSHLYVTRPFGDPALLIPWDKVRSIVAGKIVVDIEAINTYVVDPQKPILLLRDSVVDKKVLDTKDREVEVVYDVKMIILDRRLYVSDVDVSRYGLFRRLGLKWLADLIYNLANRIKRETIPWAYVEPLPANISSFKGALKLKVLKEKLSEMHPVDVADILEELAPDQRLAIFGELDTEQASDALEEINPSVQRMILSSLTKERIAELVKEMTPGQAADVLALLPSVEIQTILRLLDDAERTKIQAILEKHEEKIINYATSSFLKFTPETTVRQAIEQYRQVAGVSDVIMYLYIVDSDDKLLGVIDIRELMKATNDAQLKYIMSPVVAKLNPRSTLREASAMFNRYGFRALPIIDDEDKMLGVVPYRGMMNLKRRFLE